MILWFLGPVYGFQWRHFGAEYVDTKTDYTGQGIDQLMDVINKIKNRPDDRRIIMCAWNPADLNKMALPPCHCLVQFYVANGKFLIPLGYPFPLFLQVYSRVHIRSDKAFFKITYGYSTFNTSRK